MKRGGGRGRDRLTGRQGELQKTRLSGYIFRAWNASRWLAGRVTVVPLSRHEEPLSRPSVIVCFTVKEMNKK